jgi:hypothetical protein
MFGEGLFLEKITFDDWIKHILDLYKWFFQYLLF